MSSTPTLTPTTGEFLTFTLGEEHYGVDILKVQEIRGYDAVTRVPDAPEYIKGVINLRGTIVPVIDLRLKLRLREARYDSLTVMIVLNVEDRVVGIVVDGVSDVVPCRRNRSARLPSSAPRSTPDSFPPSAPGRADADPARHRDPARQRRPGQWRRVARRRRLTPS